MFGVIVKREFLSHMRSLRFSASFILCFAMMIASIHLLAEKSTEQDEPGRDIRSDGWVVVNDWNGATLDRLTHWGAILFRRAPILRTLCQGIGDTLCQKQLSWIWSHIAKRH
jgi:hypothetical protein